MKKERAIKLAYMAGFFDGEGCIRISSQENPPFSTRHQLQVTVGQKDGAIMDWIIGNFGGNVHQVSRDGSYSWTVSQQKALSFLKEITPFLKYKRPQAELGIRFMQRIRDRGVRGKRLSEHEIELRASLMRQMTELKKDYSGINLKGAGVTTK